MLMLKIVIKFNKVNILITQLRLLPIRYLKILTKSVKFLKIKFKNNCKF